MGGAKALENAYDMIRYVDDNKIDPADKYVEFLIRESVKLSDWYSDRVLEMWIKRYLKSETANHRKDIAIKIDKIDMISQEVLFMPFYKN